jgi:tRNA(Ile)-lysidine synthase
MVQQFKSYIQNQKLFNKNDRILLSVSGGIDSVVMTELFDKCGFRYGIAHCNFGLRGSESDEDAKFVENLSINKKVEFHSEFFKTKEFSGEEKISIQVAARQLRMRWLEKLIDRYGYNFYATAHHLDDQIETFFINLLRGTGISGLHGILPKQGKLIHPMLFTTRENIEAFAKKNKIAHREDSSNLKKDYTRNKIRHLLLPVIKEINPEYSEVLTENIHRIRQAEMIYLQQINSVASQLITNENDQIKISIRLLNAIEPAETYLYELLLPYAFNFSDVKDILASLGKQSGKMFLSNSHRLFIDRNYLIIEKLNEPESKERKYIIFKDSKDIIEPLKIEFKRIDKTPDFKYDVEENLAYLDEYKLTYPLIIRKWEIGDYFFPLGMNQKKLISDFFVDIKLSIPEKEKTWLITSGDQVVWIVGYRIDNRFKITSETKIILRMQYKK